MTKVINQKPTRVFNVGIFLYGLHNHEKMATTPFILVVKLNLTFVLIF